MPDQVKLKTRVEKIEEHHQKLNWRKGPMGAEYDQGPSLGFYVQFEGSSESIHLFDEKPPWVEGDEITITFERTADAIHR